MGQITICARCKQIACSGQLYRMLGQEHNAVVCESETRIVDGVRKARYVRGMGQSWWVDVEKVEE